MKLKNELPFITAKFSALLKAHKDALVNHIANVKAAKEYNVLEVRIAYDCFRAALTPKERMDFSDRNPDANDAHRKTLLVSGLKNSGIYSLL